eukprot:TRINITY_DN13145_c0_g2_i1.p1 TRINITY_DN13145_c0_g2~~TRINITY_DN13145_c0_g2_i1.p1  ORF type:complete len:445 (-),score=119.61 TRINITY_DN13145_c0_g2_i1:9-1343(-)
MPLLTGTGNYANYDSHFVPVSPKNPYKQNEFIFLPCRDVTLAQYHEVVVFQSAAVVPRYLVYLNKIPSPSLGTLSSSSYTLERNLFADGQVSNCSLFLWSEKEIGRGEYWNCVQMLEAVQIEDPFVDVILGWIYMSFLFPCDKEKVNMYFLRAYQKKGEMENRITELGKDKNKILKFLFGLLLVSYKEAIDKAEAIKLLKEVASDSEISSTFYILGLLYQQGDIVTRNLLLAFAYFNKASQNGHVRASYYLGCCYLYGQGVKKDVERALKLLYDAASKGDVFAQNDLGTIYEQGRFVRQDFKKVIEYYQKAANQGYGLSQFNLGVIFEYGRPGIEKNFEKAVQHYSLAAAQNFDRAQCNLARFYDEGLGGLIQDHQIVFTLVEKAANSGYPRAQYNMGVLYENGIGTPKDIEKAKHYYTLAANSNQRISPQAKHKLEYLKVNNI